MAGIDPKRSVGAVQGYSGRVFVLAWTAGDWRDERDPETCCDRLLGCGRLLQARPRRRGDRMRRRAFLAALGASAALPLSALSKPQIARIGYLGPNPADADPGHYEALREPKAPLYSFGSANSAARDTTRSI